MATQAQRRWQAACPNCGALVEFASAASASAVCSFCRSTLVRDGEALRKIGVSAELFDDYSPLQLGAAGHYAGAAFSIVGRLQMAYADGSWNEWHALFDEGKSGWVSEDNGSFVIAFDAPLTEIPPAAQSLTLGSALTLAGISWRVAALTSAHVGAAQGELPRPPLMGQNFLVAELRNAQDEVGTLDYASAPPHWSVGRPVRLADLAMTGLREDSSKTVGSRGMACPSCGAALEPKLANSQSIVCGQCHAVVDISHGAAADLAHYAQAQGRHQPQLALGSTGALALNQGTAALPWQIVGYQERCDVPAPGSDDEVSYWREYLLYNRTEGFAFLVDTDEGWSLVRPLTGVPSAGANGEPEWQGQHFKRRYGYVARTDYVAGEFYWRLAADEHVQIIDYEAPGAILSREQAGHEITWSAGRKLDATEVAKAFHLVTSQPLARDSHAFSGGSPTLHKFIVALFIIIVLMLLLRACTHDDCKPYLDNYGPNSPEYAQCKRNQSSGIIPGHVGGAFGGYTSSGGGHK